MKQDIEIVKKQVERWRIALLSEYEKSGRKASGKLGESLKVEETQSGARLIGNAYIGALVYGRRKTTAGGDGSLFKAIYQWINDKGISYKDEREHKSIAYAITKNIHEKGIKIPNQYNDGNLISNSITDESKTELQKSLSLYYGIEYTKELKRIWQI